MKLRRARRGALLTAAAGTAVALAAAVPAAAAESGPAQVPDNHGSPHAYVAGADVDLAGTSINLGPLFESFLSDGESTDSASLADFGNEGKAAGLIKGTALASKVKKSDNPRAQAGVTDLEVLPDETGLSDFLNNLIGGLGDKQDHSGLGLDNLGNLGHTLNLGKLHLGNVLGGLLNNDKGSSSSSSKLVPDSLVSAKTIKTTCSVNDKTGKVDPKTTIEDLKVLGQDIPIDKDVQDQTVDISNPLGKGDLLKLTLGETSKNNAGETIVNGVHLQVLGGKDNQLSKLLSGDVIVSHSHCGPAKQKPSPAPKPKPTTPAKPAKPAGNGQITKVPSGAPNTGGGATASTNTAQPWLLGVGGAAVLAGAGAGTVTYRRRRATQR